MSAMSGRELDGAVASKVMGRSEPCPTRICGVIQVQWSRDPFTVITCDCPAGHELKADQRPDGMPLLYWAEPCYSTDIAAAMQVVEAMRGKGVSIQIVPVTLGDCAYYVEAVTGFDTNVSDAQCDALADLPSAICTTALEALAALAGGQ